MKKIVRTVWISLLSGLAFLVACTTTKGLSRSEKKQLKAERVEIISQIDQQRQESSGVTDPTVMMNYRNTELKLRERLCQIDDLLGNEKALKDNNDIIADIHSEMDSLTAVYNATHEPGPCVYGPPPVKPDELTPLQELNKTRNDLLNQYREIQQVIQRREGACVYGSPEVIQRYGEETRRLKKQSLEIEEQVKEIEEQIRELEEKENE